MLMHILSSQVVQKQMLVRWETERPFDGQLCLEYAYQKLLKLDNPSSNYGKKFGVFMPHSVVINSNLGRISYCFRYGQFSVKNAHLTYPPSIHDSTQNLKMFPLK